MASKDECILLLANIDGYFVFILNLLITLNKANFLKDLLNPSFRYFVFSDEEAFQVLTGMVKKLVIN